MNLFGWEHEQVIFSHDSCSGLRAIIALYSTALGPALGGTRFYPYQNEDEALVDVLKLSKNMAYKNALAGLDLGGGKAVIWGDPATDKSEALLRAYGRFVESLGGRYITACDVGTTVEDMDIVGRETSHVTGRSRENGGAGDSSILTAYGVAQGMQAAAAHVWADPSLAGRRIGVAGVGKVGTLLVDRLIAEKASVVITDVSEAAIDRVRSSHPDVTVMSDANALVRSSLDIYAPCALGGVINEQTVQELSARIICGAANNQLSHPRVEKLAHDRGILYVPDYVVNCGGVIQVADEIKGFNFDRAQARARCIYQTTSDILTLAETEGVSPMVAADRIAEQRMAQIPRLRTIHLPPKLTHW